MARYEIYHDILGRAILDWQSRFKEYLTWVENRPWAYIRILSNGNILFMNNNIFSIGRWSQQDFPELYSKYISRIHMLIERTQDGSVIALEIS